VFGSCDDALFLFLNFHHCAVQLAFSFLLCLIQALSSTFSIYGKQLSMAESTGKTNRHMHSWTMADSMDSGHGSVPLSDTYVAVGVEADSRKGKGQQVKAPEGSAHLEVRCSSRVASAKAKSVQAAAPRPPLVKAPPGMRPLAGYQYEVLLILVEHGEKELVQWGGLSTLSGKVIGSRDITVIQAGLKAVPVAKVGPNILSPRKFSFKLHQEFFNAQQITQEVGTLLTMGRVVGLTFSNISARNMSSQIKPFVILIYTSVDAGASRQLLAFDTLADKLTVELYIIGHGATLRLPVTGTTCPLVSCSKLSLRRGKWEELCGISSLIRILEPFKDGKSLDITQLHSSIL
jgi:hypothetical protein